MTKEREKKSEGGERRGILPFLSPLAELTKATIRAIHHSSLTPNLIPFPTAIF